MRPEPPDPPLAWFDSPCLASFKEEYASGCEWNARVLEYHAGATAPKPVRAARRGGGAKGAGPIGGRGSEQGGRA